MKKTGKNINTYNVVKCKTTTRQARKAFGKIHTLLMKSFQTYQPPH